MHTDYTPKERRLLRRAWERVIQILETDSLAQIHSPGLCILLFYVPFLPASLRLREQQRLREMFGYENPETWKNGFGAFIWDVDDQWSVYRDPSRWARLMAAVVMRDTV